MSAGNEARSGRRRRAGAGAHHPGPRTENAVFERQSNGRKAGGKAKPERTRLLARLHLLKRDLKLDDETYRAVLWTVCQLETAGDADSHQLRALVTHLEGKLPKAQRYKGTPKNIDTPQSDVVHRIEALLADAQLPWSYAIAIARQMFGKQRLEWCTAAELDAVHVALNQRALKTLAKEFQTLFGEHWHEPVAGLASLLFGFDSTHCDIRSYSEPQSRVLRWWRGEASAVCTWPLQADVPGQACCSGCRDRFLGRP